MNTIRLSLQERTPAQLAALTLGAFWVLNGVAVFAYGEPAPWALGGSGEVPALGTSISANGWHGLLHLATGLAGLAAYRSPASARAYAASIGGLYLALALWALAFNATTVAGVIYVDRLGSAEHLLEAILLLTAAAVSGVGTSATQP